MQVKSIGDLTQTLMLQQRSADLRKDMLRLGQEMSTRKVFDVATTLGGDFARLSGIEHRMSVLNGFKLANSEAASFFEAAQLRLGNVTETVASLGASVLSIGSSPLANAINATSQEARIALEDALASLNGTHAGRALFSGTATDRTPLVTAEDLLTELRTVVAGATTAADLLNSLTAWFDDPAGFRDFAYQGSITSLAPLAADDSRKVVFHVRADHEHLRNALRDIAGVVLAVSATKPLDNGERAAALSASGQNLLASRDGLIAVSAELGVAQETIERSAVRMQSETYSLNMARNALISADPFETATQLQNVQLQLESLYAITARTSQLTLARFL